MNALIGALCTLVVLFVLGNPREAATQQLPLLDESTAAIYAPTEPAARDATLLHDRFAIADAEPNLWTVRAGAVFFARTDPSVNLTPSAEANPALPSFIPINFDTATGVDASIARAVGVDQAIELRFLGGNQWSDTQTLLVEPEGIPAEFTTSYTSRLYSTEVNLWQPGNQWFRWLVGFRWIELHERAQIELSGPDGFLPTSYAAHNHLYGGQLGANLALWNGAGPLRVDALLKAGVFGNSANNHLATTIEIIEPVELTADSVRGQVAFAGEIELAATYQITRHIAVRGGYELLWLDGVALAGDQFTELLNVFSGGGGINTTANVFFHGAIVDLQIMW